MISPIIVVTLPTRPTSSTCSVIFQAALAHLESIIYDPFEKKDEEPKAEKIDGEVHDATAKEKPKDMNGA